MTSKHVSRRQFLSSSSRTIFRNVIDYSDGIDGTQQSPRGGDWSNQSDREALTLQEMRDIKEQEIRERNYEQRRRYLQRLEDLGVGRSGGGSSESGGEPPPDSDDSSSSDSGSESSESADASGSGSPAPTNGDWAEPMSAAVDNISSGYKSPDRPGHKGIDIAKPAGEKIFAVTDGVVAAAGPASGFGNWIVLDHDIDGKKYSTVYGHMYAQDVLVKAGDQVKAGDHIANEGSDGESTGPHLHFEVWDGGRLDGGVEVDPTDWARKGKK